MANVDDDVAGGAPAALRDIARKHRVSIEAATITVLKERLANEWSPEYEPAAFRPPHVTNDTVTERNTYVDLDMILKEQHTIRKTKIVCTMGPACWSEEGIGQLVDAGLNIARFNFSHGDHEGQGGVLERFREVVKAKGAHCATLLDTKGPEIRTAMLRDGANIKLEKGQKVIVQAVGADYVNFEGYKTEEETRIGLSYDKLCQSVKPGNHILIADGTVVIEVDEILSDTELRGTMLNSKELGQRKNCNLPGVKVDLPVLMEKDIDDLQNFGCKYKVDYVAASFVQSGEDIKFIRRVLDEAGGQHIKIIAKIENYEGLKNFDEILEETDGVMVARGDLGMEIPSEKVPIAQKQIITKSNIAGKFVICATQMLESMIVNPRPTRAEMTDVANAVYDGVDAVMLSGETANGSFPGDAVATMAGIVSDAELGVDMAQQYAFLRFWNTLGGTKPMHEVESLLSTVSNTAIDFQDLEKSKDTHAVIVVASEDGSAAELVSKYRPPCPVIVATSSDVVMRQTSGNFAQYPLFWDKNTSAGLAEAAAEMLLKMRGVKAAPVKVIVVKGHKGLSADVDPVVMSTTVGGAGMKKAFASSATLIHASGAPAAARPGVVSVRSTRTNLDLINKPVHRPRATKIVCTIGPACWDQNKILQLLDAGLDIVRFNFSHGDHDGHYKVLTRFREACEMKAQEIKDSKLLPCKPSWATLLDTKGPEIRTAMLRDGANIQLEAGQSIIVEAVGDDYVNFEGYKTEEETRIGLSYAKLCTSVKPGNKILLADGSITIQVEEILNVRELRGTVLNSKELGQRKNCNLPGVKIELPVLMEKDINDLQNFGCKHKVDYVAASFVQSAEDVNFIRRVLDEAGGEEIRIISKIENTEGLKNFDEILKVTDGIMVARGDLGMEISPEKVPLAQKWMITKCQLAGKFVICATQMLESMIDNPRPTRAEMTDVANAVLDGVDAVMLSGETANGSFPEGAVDTMAAIVQNAEQLVETQRNFKFIRNRTPKPMSDAESLCNSAVQTAIDIKASAILVLTSSGRAAGLVSKYRPRQPVFIMTDNPHLAASSRSRFGQTSLFMPGQKFARINDAIPLLVQYANNAKMGMELTAGDQIVVVHRRPGQQRVEDQRLTMRVVVIGKPGGVIDKVTASAYPGNRTAFYRSTKIGLDTLLDVNKFAFVRRKTKIVCTMGPACWSEEGIGKLLDAGLAIARFNFSHGDHEGQGGVLARFRAVCMAKGSHAATMLDTKGPEIRTAMLRDGANIKLEKGQKVIVQAVGDDYVNFEGYKTEEETRIGLSYAKLCQSVKPGNHILIADGSVIIEVDEILSDTELRGTMLNSKELGQRKNCNLPGVKVDLPVLMPKDIDDIQNFACKKGMDFIAASFVQSADDVKMIRRVLDEAGGQHIKIISKIENFEGLKNFDEILEETDGVMVARGDLGMEIPVEKVPLAQKWMITKSNIAGKFVICATQMMESMIDNPFPTRAEMTDVASAVFDGADAVMLSGETANGAFPDQTVATMSRIATMAEVGTNHYQNWEFIHEYTRKPVGTVEAVASCAVKTATETVPGLIIVFSQAGKMPSMLAKYRPQVPVMVLTTDKVLARRCSALYGVYPYVIDNPPKTTKEVEQQVWLAMNMAVRDKLCVSGKEVIVVTSTMVHGQVAGANDTEVNAERQLYITTAPGRLNFNELGVAQPAKYTDKQIVNKTLSMRSVNIDLDMLIKPEAPVRKSKVIATLGPRLNTTELMVAAIKNGMDVARINLSHGTEEANMALTEAFRAACAETGKHVPLYVALTSQNMYTSKFLDQEGGSPIDKAEIKADQFVTIYFRSHEEVEANKDAFVGWPGATATIGVAWWASPPEVERGDTVMISDGAVAFHVQSKDADGTLHCRAVNTGVIGARKAFGVLGRLSRPPAYSLTRHKDTEMVKKLRPDFVEVAHVGSADVVAGVREALIEAGLPFCGVVAKIESVNDIKNIDEIMGAVDGILVARGSLGLELTPERVLLASKVLTTKANVAGKPVIITRQMLHSMAHSPRPTRAEMTDVANCVIDGADAIMFGPETAAGDWPVETIETAANILRNTEGACNYYAMGVFVEDFTARPLSTLESAATIVAEMVADAHCQLSVVVTNLPDAVRLVSKYRPQVPVVIVTTDDSLARQCNMNFGCYAQLVESLGSIEGIDELVAGAVEYAKAQGIFSAGPVAVLHGLGQPDVTSKTVSRIIKC